MTIPLRAALPRRSSCQPGHSWAEASLAEVSDSLAAERRTFPREAPIRHCSGWGLPCRSCCQSRGGLLPHRFTLTLQAGRFVFCGAFPGVAPAGRYPAPLLHGVRTFLARLATHAVIQPSARQAAYACPTGASTGKRVARSTAMARSVASTGPEASGRNRARKAASSRFSPTSG